MAKRKVLFQGIKSPEIQGSMEKIQKTDFFTDPSFQKLYQFFLDIEAGRDESWKLERGFFRSVLSVMRKEKNPIFKEFEILAKAFFKSRGIAFEGDSDV